MFQIRHRDSERMRRAMQALLTGFRRVGSRALASTVLLIGGSLAPGQSHAGGAIVQFTQTTYFGDALFPVPVIIDTNFGGSPDDGGDIRFDTSACTLPPTISPPSPLSPGFRSFDFLFLGRESCSIDVFWDPDGPGGQPEVPGNFTATFDINDFNVAVINAPGGTLTPYDPPPTFEIEFRNGSIPQVGFGIGWSVLPPSGPPIIISDFCDPMSPYVTDGAGRSRFSFADMPGVPILETGLYSVAVQGIDLAQCSLNKSNGSALGKGVPPPGSQNFNVLIEDVELVFDNPPTLVQQGETVPFPVRLRGTTSGAGIGGQTVSWSLTPSSVGSPSGGSFVTDGNGDGVITITGGTPDLMGAFLAASVPVPLPSPNDLRAANTNFAVVALGLALETPAPGPTFTDELAGPFSVLATSDSGNGDDPVPMVPITFTITSGNATFPGGTTSALVNTDAFGIALSPPVEIGRTSGPVVVEADGGAYGTVSQNYSVQASTYSLTASNTPIDQDTGQFQSVNLAVLLERTGSSTPLPLPSENIDWQISPNDGSSISPSPATTDTLGVSTVSFFPVGSGTYTVTANFNTGFTTNPSQAFTINVSAPVLTLDVVSGDGQVGDPGSNLPEPLVVRALDDGLPPASAFIEWSATGGVLLSSSSQNPTPGSLITELADSSGLSSVQVTLPAQPGTFTVTATRIQGFPNKGKGASLPVGPSVSFTVSVGGDSVFELRPLEGDGQQGLVNQPGVPLAAQLLIDGAPSAAGFAVEWAVQQGDVELDSTSTQTDLNGTARVGLRFGATAGESLILATSARGAQALFRVTANAELSLVIVSGDGQSAAPGGALADEFVVEVRSGTRVLSGVQVNWSVLTGGGVLALEQGETDTAGRTNNRLTLGPQPGEQRVAASLLGGQQVVFTATATGASRGLSIVRGNQQRGLVFSTAGLPLEVLLTDQDGAPIAGTTVTWEVNGSATLAAPTSTTDGDGLAQNTITFGASAGLIQVTARSPDATQPVVFTLTATLPSLASIGGDGQSGTVNQPLPQDLSVDLALPNAKGLAGVPVQWQVLTGGGTLAAATTTSDAQGKASNSWTLGGLVGEQTVQATLPGGQMVLFSATAEAEGGQVGTLRLVSGTPQTIPTNTPSAPLVVEVVNADGGPLNGVLIEWSASSEFVSLRDASNRTGTDGRASNVATLQIPGAVTVTASVADSDIAPVTFQLAGGVAQIPGLGDEERDIGIAIDNACPALAVLPSRTPEQEDLFQRCSEFVGNAGSNPGEVRNALGELPTDIGPSMAGQGINTATTQFDNVDTRLHMIRGEQTGAQRNQFNIGLWTPDGTLPLSFLPSAFMAAGATEEQEAGLDFDRWGFFATGQIGRGEVDAGERSPEFDFDIAGLTFGVDYRFSDQLVAGVALGYSDNDAELAGNRGDVATQGWNLSGYATWYSESSWYVDGTLMFGRLDYDLRRRINYSITALDGSRTNVDQVASANTDGDLFGASMSIGRDWQKGPWSINGYFRGQYSRVETDAFVERMIAGLPGQGLALAIDSRSTESMTSVVGGRATYILSRDWGILMPNFSVEWEHEFEDDPGRLTARLAFDPTGTTIERFSDEIDTDYFNVGVGVSALFPGGRSAYLYYEELVGASRLSQGLLSLGVRFEF